MASESKTENGKPTATGYQFGTFKGVFTPSILTILGVIMYLRFGWVLGNVGLVGTLVIVTMSSLITFLTGLSLAALATNREIKGGGAYFIISRSLGIEAGAAVGIPLFFAQALAVSFYIAGFSEAMIEIFPMFSVKIVGIVTLIILTGIAYRSADLALKTQFVVMALIFLSLVSFFMGGAPEVPVSRVPISAFKPSFWMVFAVFFPAVTGIEAGIAMSGDLKKPARALPLGTIAAVLVGYAVYMAIPFFLHNIVKDKDLLLSAPLIMRNIARWGSLIVLGVWAATLSSAMGCLLGAPRTLQAIARDRIIPGFFGKGFGKGNDPRIATMTVFLIGLVGILAGDLNLIAPVLSMFFLTSYGLLNVSAGLEELTGPPSWRPQFRVPWMFSIVGAFGCFAVMFMINAGATFIAGFLAFTIYALMERRSLTSRWGDIRRGILMLIARAVVYRLARRGADERTWQPNILVLSGAPTSRWYLIGLAGAISRERGFLTVAAMMPPETTADRMEQMTRTLSDYLKKRGVPALVKVQSAETPLRGARVLAAHYGYGPIAPNTILLGETENPESYRDFAELVQAAHSQRQNLVVVREGEKKPEEELASGSRLDIWWYGTPQNVGFMLALAHLLHRSPRWTKAAMILKSIVDKADQKEETLRRLQGFIQKVRIRATAEVLVRDSSDTFDMIRKQSVGADLVFVGMREPGAGENSEEYSAYYARLLEQTRGLPPTAMILASEKTDFSAIFNEAEA